MTDTTKRVPELALGNSHADKAVAVARAVAGSVPIAGPFIAELVTSVIPNQRLDRVEAFLMALARELERLEAAEKVTQAVNLPLVEEGIAQAARAFSPEPREYLAKCVAGGIGAPDKAKFVELKILQMLGELADYDLLLLDAYSREDWVQRVQKLQSQPSSSTVDDMLVLRGIEKGAQQRLEALGLLVIGGIDERSVGKDARPKRLSNITVLGEMLLLRAGLGATSPTRADTPPAP